MICARSRSLALVVVSYTCRSSVTWGSDKGGRVRGWDIGPFRKDGQHHITPALYRKYFLEAFSISSRNSCARLADSRPWRKDRISIGLTLTKSATTLKLYPRRV